MTHSALSLPMTKHANARIRQRGLHETDIPILLNIGTSINETTIYLTSKDVALAIAKRKQEIARLERLKGCRLVVRDNQVITIYRASAKTNKKMMRELRHHAA